MKVEKVLRITVMNYLKKNQANLSNIIVLEYLYAQPNEPLKQFLINKHQGNHT